LDLDEALAATSEPIRIRIETRRYGKQTTVLDGFARDADLNKIATEMKRAIGTGGTAKENTVELQGDQRRAARAWLESHGFRVEGP
jgi:translation initiation factor 1